MNINDCVDSISFNKDFSISGKYKMIKMSEIEGFGHGDFHYTNLNPGSACIVKKTNTKYTLLNENNLNVKSLLEQYDQSTMVVVFVISSTNDTDKIKFLTGDLIPHQTSNSTFSDLFKSIVVNKQYQKWISKHFTIKESRANSKVSFNLDSFIQILGKNTPSKVTLDRLIKSATITDIELDLNSISTRPTQLDTHQSNELQELQELQPEISERDSQPKLSEQEMQVLWDTYSHSKYAYSKIRELLPAKENTLFTERINELRLTPEKLANVTSKLEIYLNAITK